MKACFRKSKGFDFKMGVPSLLTKEVGILQQSLKYCRMKKNILIPKCLTNTKVLKKSNLRAKPCTKFNLILALKLSWNPYFKQNLMP